MKRFVVYIDDDSLVLEAHCYTLELDKAGKMKLIDYHPIPVEDVFSAKRGRFYKDPVFSTEKDLERYLRQFALTRELGREMGNLEKLYLDGIE